MEKKTYSNLLVSSAPHIVSNMDTQKIMLTVIIALLPSLIVSIFIFGARVLLVAAVGVLSAIVFEWLWNLLMKKPQTVGDLSAALTGLLLAYNLPAGIPIWMVVVGSFVAIIIVKQLFGGLGKNITNPAITARIVLFISFATEMTDWAGSPVKIADAVSSPTPLGALANVAEEAATSGVFDTSALPSNLQMFLGTIGGSLGEVCAIALLAGGLFLVIRKIISPIIPVCFIGTVFVFAVIYYAATGYGNPWEMGLFHILAGGVMLGAIFMATDYVTSPLLPWAKVIFGIGCGAMTMIIRIWGQYPEGVSFSILLMNCLTPLINNFVQKKMYGGAKNGK